MQDDEAYPVYHLHVFYGSADGAELLDISSHTPFLAIHKGDWFTAKAFKKNGWDEPDHGVKFISDNLLVADVIHSVWVGSNGLASHGITVVVQDPKLD